jgi:hypothetical protein
VHRSTIFFAANGLVRRLISSKKSVVTAGFSAGDVRLAPEYRQVPARLPVCGAGTANAPSICVMALATCFATTGERHRLLAADELVPDAIFTSTPSRLIRRREMDSQVIVRVA